MSAIPTVLPVPRPRPVGFVANNPGEVERAESMTFDSLAHLLGEVKAGKKAGHGWVPADIPRGRRLKEQVRSVSWLVFDVEARAENVKGADGEIQHDEYGDNVKRSIGPEPPALDELVAELEIRGWRACLHTSYSHSLEHSRYRVVFDISRPITPGELQALTIHLAGMLGLSDCYDNCSAEASRLYYLPRCPEPRLELFQCRLTNGDPLPIDTLLHDAQRAEEALRKALERATARQASGRGEVIEKFNAHHDVGKILEQHGYLSKGRGRWLHPDSTTGDPGVRLLPESTAVYSSHGNCALNDGHAHDAFDVYRLLEHGGDLTSAVREVARMLGLNKTTPTSITTSTTTLKANAEEGNPPSTRFRPMSVEELLEQPEPGWLVHGLLPRIGVAQLLGESHAGKTFAALHLAAAVAQGVPWFNQDIDAPACVVYVSGEGSLRRRVKAHLTHYGLKPADLERLRLLERAVNLLDATQVDELLFHLHELKQRFDGLGLVVLDTYARMTPGGDEGRQHTGLAVSTCDRLRDELGCCVLLLHHPGYSNSERGRGHSSLYAALDTEITLATASKGCDAVRTLTVSKNRDGEADKVFGAFQLEVIEVDIDAKGRPSTSCAVLALDDEQIPQAAPRRAKRTPREAMLLQALNEELDDREARITATTKHIQVGAKIDQNLAREDGVRQRFYAKLGDVNQPHHVYRRARESLTGKRLIGSAEGVLWLAD